MVLPRACSPNVTTAEECLREISPDLHGANVDLKSFSDRFYKEQCGAKLDPVLKSLEIMKSLGVWLEVTTLLIPGLNDSEQELRELARFLAALDPDIPWHISRFHPTYRLTQVRDTPAETIHRAKEIGSEEGLKYVYTGNLPGDDGEKPPELVDLFHRIQARVGQNHGALFAQIADEDGRRLCRRGQRA